MKICLVGEGAFAHKHLEAVANIDGIEIAGIVGGVQQDTQATAEKFGIPYWTLNLNDALTRSEIEAVIIASPTPIHAAQAQQVMAAGKHVLIEIPMADNLADARALCATQSRTRVIAMVGHTRRFNPSHQWLYKKIRAGELNIQHLDVQTFFFRRKNLNALGQPRSWTDHLLWHHACHTVDLFAYQTGEKIVEVQAMQGPPHPELGIAMDLSIGMKSESGALCTLSLSFNNDGPFGTFFRYICDNGTYIARYDELMDGNEKEIDVREVAVSLNGIELEQREFFGAIREQREPNSSVQQALYAMEILDKLEQKLRKP